MKNYSNTSLRTGTDTERLALTPAGRYTLFYTTDASPDIGDKYYIWNGISWLLLTQRITISATPPGTPGINDLWVDIS